MALFADDPCFADRLDFDLLRDGGFWLYRSETALAADVDWLEQEGYRVIRLDCRGWQSGADALTAIARVMDFPAYFGGNLDALADCLGAVEVPEDGGLVFVLDAFEAVPRADRFAWRLLDVLAWESRQRLLFEEKLVVLLLSGDPGLELEPVGAVPVARARRELRPGR